jgi:hypothetical protein
MSTPVIVLTLLVVVLGVGEFLLFGALAEAYRDIRQIRETEGILDRPTPVDLGSHAGALASSIGLPSHTDDLTEGLALFVDSRCTTCRAIVSSLAGAVPPNVVLTAIAPSQSEARKWLVHSGGFALPEEDDWTSSRLMIATPEDVQSRLGVLITPLGIAIEHGRLARASTVPSVRAFYKQLSTGIALPNTRPDGALT